MSATTPFLPYALIYAVAGDELRILAVAHHSRRPGYWRGAPVGMRRRTTMRGELPKHEVGSGNLFADVGLPDAALHLLKAEIVNRIDEILRERRLTQAAAARLLGISQPDVSMMLRGLFRGFSLERLLVFLAALGQDVTIDVRRRRKAGSIWIAA